MLLAIILQSVGMALSGYVAILVLADVYLVAIHLRRATRRLAQERLDAAVSGSSLDPLVCVQLPVFNEPAMIGPAIDSLCGLDWPGERLQILVLDDSTDETSTRAAERVAHWRARGVSISHVVRTHRQDYKAGALASAMSHTSASYLAIFDVDYRPAPGFLRSTMAVLLAEPRLAFVQARLDYRNREHNALTRAQAIELDTFQAYEQAARNWAGVPTTFNGTCGVWRRQAIDEAGGWSGRSLVEDQDLSFRTFALGWRCRNLVSVAVSGELPESFDVLAVQRTRWGAGTAQAFYDLPWRLLRHLRWHQAMVFVLLAQFYASISLLLGTIAVVGVTNSILEPTHATPVWLSLLAALALLVTAKSAGAMLATRAIGRPLGLPFITDILSMWLMEAALLPIIGRSLLTGFLSRRLPFRRTPKKGY